MQTENLPISPKAAIDAIFEPLARELQEIEGELAQCRRDLEFQYAASIAAFSWNTRRS